MSDLDDFLNKADKVAGEVLQEYQATMNLIFQKTERNKRGAELLGIGSLIALGLGISNRLDIEAMKNRVAGIESQNDAIVKAVQQLAQGTDQQLQQLRSDMANYRDTTNERFISASEQTLKREIRRLLRNWREEADELEIAVADLLAGQLSPHIISPKELAEAIDGLKPQLAQRNLRLVSWTNPAQAAYVAQATIIAHKEGTGLHIFVHIPVTATTAADRSLWLIRQHPMLLTNHSIAVQNMEGDSFLAVDLAGNTFTDIPVDEVTICLKRQETFLCPHTVVTKGVKTCNAAIWLREWEKVASLCQQSIVAMPFHVFNDNTGMTVWSESQQLVTIHCVNSSKTFPVYGLQQIEVGPGCFLETEDRIVFKDNQDSDVRTTVTIGPARSQDIEALLLGEDPKEIKRELANSETPQPLTKLVQGLRRQKREQGQHGAHIWLAAGGGAAILAAAVTSAFAIWRCSRVVIPIIETGCGLADEIQKTTT